MKVDAVEAAIGRPELVLAANIFSEYLLLDVDRLAAEVALADHPAIERMERIQQPDRERAARAQTGPRRQVGVVMDFKPVGTPMSVRMPRTAGCSISANSLTNSTLE